MSALRPRVFRFQVVMIVVMALVMCTILLTGFGSTESAWVVFDATKEMDDRVAVDEDDGVFLVERGTRVIAFSNRGPWNNEPVFYCASSQMFETTRSGSKFDVYGHYFAGPAPRGLTRYPVRVRDGDILINVAEPMPGLGRRASSKRVRQPVGHYCVPY